MRTLSEVRRPGQVPGLALGSCSYRPNATTTERLRGAELILNALDSDAAGAGQFWSWWAVHFPNSRRLPIPGDYDAKDPSEAHAQGLDIRSWVKAGLHVYGQEVKETVLSPAQMEDYQERAAILEFDAGFTRDRAERMAREMIGGK